NMRRPMGDATLPMALILLLYFVVFMFGCLIYPEDTQVRDFSLRNLYFSVVSFATVGFGDESPKSSTWQRMIPMFVYLMFGMILSGMMFSVIHHKFRRITKVGSKVNHASDVTIWFGSESMKVSKFLEIIAEEFNKTSKSKVDV
uniref:Potassium channel domain-containing protein n=1 Tax=Panagrolaimus sp. JU765 TaxID=591449 RepID=A0AC34PW87_9BILA